MAGAVLSHTNAHLEGHCLWYVSMSSSEIYCRKNLEHLQNDNCSRGLAIDYFLCWWKCTLPNHQPTHQTHFNVVFFFASWAALLYNVALWCRTAVKSHFRRWNHECHIPLVKAFTKVKSKKNQLGLTPDSRQVFVFCCFCLFLIEGEKKPRKSSHFAVLYNTVFFFPPLVTYKDLIKHLSQER